LAPQCHQGWPISKGSSSVHRFPRSIAWRSRSGSWEIFRCFVRAVGVTHRSGIGESLVAVKSAASGSWLRSVTRGWPISKGSSSVHRFPHLIAWEAPGGNRGIAWVLTWCLRANAASALPLSARSRSRLPVLGLVHTWLRGSGLVMFSRLPCSGPAVSTRGSCAWARRCSRGSRAWEAPGGNRGIAWVLTWCLRANAASALPLSARSRSRLPVLGLVHTWLRGSGLVMFSRLPCSGPAVSTRGSCAWEAPGGNRGIARRRTILKP